MVASVCAVYSFATPGVNAPNDGRRAEGQRERGRNRAADGPGGLVDDGSGGAVVGGDVALAVLVREQLERVGHADELVVVPRAAEQLQVDRLAVVVDARREDDGRDARAGARRVAAAEARLAATAVVERDVAQQARVDDGVDAEVVGARGVQPRLGVGLVLQRGSCGGR